MALESDEKRFHIKSVQKGERRGTGITSLSGGIQITEGNFFHHVLEAMTRKGVINYGKVHD